VIDPDLHHLLLSPRARVKKNGDYLCCSQCERALRNDRLDKNPPKFAIANNFAIGSLPKNLLSLVTDVTSPLLSPVRPFAYILSYSGGAHKVITGSFSFFNQSIEKNIGALNFHRQSTNSNNVYVVISGNFTPNQRQIIRTRCTVDVSQFNEIYTWLRGHNPTFSVMPEISNCPSPLIIEDDSSSDDEPKNPNLESQVEIQYWFPNNGNPTGPNSVFYSQTALVDALINSKEPTLIFTSTNYQPDYKLTLPMVFPLHFPFGVGGIEDVRRTPVSIEEILKYYLNISLPLFQRSDIILVICHIYFRRKSFQSAYLKCMSKSSQNGHTTGEYLSNITESEIIELSKKKKNEINGQIGATSTRLIHSVTAACKSIPYSDEAAKEARTKLFSMWYNFGPPAVFFTISPGDECNFRIKLYLNTKMDLLPQPDADENVLVSDSLFRAKLRIDNPGACAREYNAIMQIIMEALVGWNVAEQKQTSMGIFGEVLGWSDTTEEQGRTTLHSHLLLYIAFFDKLISLLWSNSVETRNAAKEELCNYMKKIMTSSYELVDEDYCHQKPKSIDEGSHVQCRIIPTIVPNQTLRNMRHEKICHMLNGVIGRCENCGETFTSPKIIWNAVRNWVKKNGYDSSSIFQNVDNSVPVSLNRIDNFSQRFTYDMEYYTRNPCEEMERILRTLILFRYNEHDYHHRKGCFKKTEECRFFYPKQIQPISDLIIDWKSEPSKWFSAPGTKTAQLTFPFAIEMKRQISDLYLNTNNPVVSKIFGYNNNVTTGNRNCIYYVTLYNTKGNQEEEQFPYLKHCTALAKRIKRIRDNSEHFGNQFENEGSVITQQPSFSVGLGHVLSGIMSHLSSTVIGATMAWHLVNHDSRFQFSHDFSHILLSQFECWLRNEDIQFRYRRIKNKDTGWIDSNLFQYLYRPDLEQFENICVWDFFRNYQMRLISSLSTQQVENLENDFEENQFFKFTSMYPGFNFACLECLKKPKLPMLFYNDNIPDLELCKVDADEHSAEIDATTWSIRNEYATKMLLLFLPFRDKTDFPEFEDRWNYFRQAQENGVLYWDATRLMQNIQDVENSKKISAIKDEVVKTTEMSLIEHHLNDSEDQDEHDDTEPNRIHQFKEVDVDLIMEEMGIHESLLHSSIQSDISVGGLNTKMQENHVIANPVTENKSVFLENEGDVPDEATTTSQDRILQNRRPQDIIRVILDLNKYMEQDNFDWSNNSDNVDFNFNSVSFSMESCIRHFGLDPKQAAAFNIICSSFMLTFLNDPTLTQFGSPEEKKQATEILQERGGHASLIMHLTGSGGSGKSFVLNATRSFCRNFCKIIGQPFDDSVFIVSATTNTAAAQVQGDTIHSLAGLRGKLRNVLRNSRINWKYAKLLFLDEISMFDIKDFLKLDKYLRHFIAQYNPEAINFPFGGLNVVLCGDFSQLNPIGRDVIYNRNANPLWHLINRLIILNFQNHRFSADPDWGNCLRRIHLGRTTKDDITKINTRVIGSTLSLPTPEELDNSDITYACATNADRNLISDNIFANVLKHKHPKENESFEIPNSTIIIKGNFEDLKSGDPKSQIFHKLIHNKCGDDNVQSGNGQNIIRVDPCLKLFYGCPLMVSTNDNKSIGAVKGTTAKFRGIKLKQNKEMKIEIWNGYKVFTVNSDDVMYILCEHTKKSPDDPPRCFQLPTKSFTSIIKFPVQNSQFLKLDKCKVIQFPVNNDLATTGHKLQGMTKKYLIMSSLNYSTSNWIYVVLSRVTTLNGLFLMHPLRANFNPQPTKLLREEWELQRTLEFDTLTILQKYGHFPDDIDIVHFANLSSTEHDNTCNTTNSVAITSARGKKINRKNMQIEPKQYSSMDVDLHNFDHWLRKQLLRRLPHKNYIVGNCLYDSVAVALPAWSDKSLELRLMTIQWAEAQLKQGTIWGKEMWKRFEDTKANPDSYGKNSFLEYLSHMQNPSNYGTEYDIIMLAEFLNISIIVYSSSLITVKNNTLACTPPHKFGRPEQTTITLWHYKEHYELIVPI